MHQSDIGGSSEATCSTCGRNSGEVQHLLSSTIGLATLLPVNAVTEKHKIYWRSWTTGLRSECGNPEIIIPSLRWCRQGAMAIGSRSLGRRAGLVASATVTVEAKSASHSLTQIATRYVGQCLQIQSTWLYSRLPRGVLSEAEHALETMWTRRRLYVQVESSQRKTSKTWAYFDIDQRVA